MDSSLVLRLLFPVLVALVIPRLFSRRGDRMLVELRGTALEEKVTLSARSMNVDLNEDMIT